MYLIDTQVISEARKQTRANPGVVKFFTDVDGSGHAIYLSAVTVGELRRGVELLRHRRDLEQADRLETWLEGLLGEYEPRILPFDSLAAQVWGRLRVPNPDHAIDKQIAAIALVHNLVLVTRNIDDFRGTGVQSMNPFLPAGAPPLP